MLGRQSQCEDNVPNGGSCVLGAGVREMGMKGPSIVRCSLSLGPRMRQSFPLLPLCTGYPSVPFQAVAPHRLIAYVGFQALTPSGPET